MPRIEINRRRTGTHAKLIDRDRRVVDDANPPNDAARRAFEARRIMPPVARTLPRYMPMPPPNLLTWAKLSMLR